MDKEPSDLNLAVGIESNDTDVSIWEGLGACLDLGDDLATISASEHWELPHCPVAVVVVVWCSSVLEADNVLVGGVRILWVGELKARGPSVADHVIDLLGDVLLGEWWEVGEGLEEPIQGGVNASEFWHVGEFPKRCRIALQTYLLLTGVQTIMLAET